MPDCHKCKYNGQRNARCIGCPGPSQNPNNHGQRIVSLEAMPPKEIARLTQCPKEPESKMAAFMRNWLFLPPKNRDLISRAVIEQPKSCAALARKVGVSRQYVHRTLLKNARSFPELNSVLHLLVRATSKN